LTENMFGDIISDLTATFAWSLWLLASSSFNDEWFGLYEPAGGSAPDIAWKWIANPIAQILCVSMMLRYSFGEIEAADAIERAVENAISQWYRTQDIYKWLDGEKLVDTKQMGDVIANLI
jgi:3-isopropylmalate dehydrogenase